MAKKREQRISRSVRRSAQSPLRWWGAIAFVVVIVVTGLALWRPQNRETPAPVAAGVFPTPIGFPETAQDVGTREGEAVPAFTLADESGQLVTVDPAEAKRPIVLIFNMGLG